VPICSITTDDKGANMLDFNDVKGKEDLMRHAEGLHVTDPSYELSVLGHGTFNKLLEISLLLRATAPHGAEPAVR
jgi:hypothetical protein